MNVDNSQALINAAKLRFQSDKQKSDRMSAPKLDRAEVFRTVADQTAKGGQKTFSTISVSSRDSMWSPLQSASQIRATPLSPPSLIATPSSALPSASGFSISSVKTPLSPFAPSSLQSIKSPLTSTAMGIQGPSPVSVNTNESVLSKDHVKLKSKLAESSTVTISRLNETSVSAHAISPSKTSSGPVALTSLSFADGWMLEEFQDEKYNRLRKALLQVLASEIDYPLLIPHPYAQLVSVDLSMNENKSLQK